MMRLGAAFIFAAGFMFGLVGDASAGKRANSFIVLRGCAHYQVPACTKISSGGQTYSLVGASPPVPLNVGVTVVGTKSGDIGVCFATSIKVVKWSRNKLRCPL